jgi:hypothetical protein
MRKWEKKKNPSPNSALQLSLRGCTAAGQGQSRRTGVLALSRQGETETTSVDDKRLSRLV